MTSITNWELNKVMLPGHKRTIDYYLTSSGVYYLSLKQVVANLRLSFDYLLEHWDKQKVEVFRIILGNKLVDYGCTLEQYCLFLQYQAVVADNLFARNAYFAMGEQALTAYINATSSTQEFMLFGKTVKTKQVDGKTEVDVYTLSHAFKMTPNNLYEYFCSQQAKNRYQLRLNEIAS